MQTDLERYLADETPTAPAQPKTNLERYLDGDDAEASVRQSLTAVEATGVTPQQAVEAKQLSKKLGMPPVVVEADLDGAKKRAEQQEIISAARKDPDIEWLMRDPNMAKVARGDVGSLTKLSEVVKSIPSSIPIIGPVATAYGFGIDAAPYIGNSLERGVLRVKQGAQQFMAESARRAQDDQSRSFLEILQDAQNIGGIAAMPMQLALPNAATRYLQSRYDSAVGVDNNAIAQQRMLSVGQTANEISQIEMSPAATRFREAVQQGESSGGWTGALSAAASDPLGALAFIGEAGLESFPQLAAMVGITAATKNPLAGAAVMGGASGLTERYVSPAEFFQDKGIDLRNPEAVRAIFSDKALLDEAQQYGFTRGAIIGSVDALSGGIASRTLMSSPLGNMLAQMLVQTTSAGAGEAGAQLATKGKVSPAEVIFEALGELFTAPAEVATLNSQYRNQIQISRITAKVAVKTANDATKAREEGAALDAVVETAVQTPLREQDPETFRAFMKQVAARTGREDVSIPADKLVEYCQSVGLDPYSIPEIADDLADAHANGEDVIIPLDAYVTNIAPDHHAGLAPHIRVDLDSLTRQEAEESSAAFEALVQEENERIAAAMADENVAAVEQVKQDAKSQYVESGAYAPEVAEFGSISESKLWGTWASRLGGAIGTAADLYNKHRPLRVAPVNEAAQLRQRVDDLELDIAALKARRGAKTSDPYLKQRAAQGAGLLEFIARRGGIEEFSGEMKSRGADKWHRKYPGMPKLVRPERDRSQSAMAGMAGDNEYTADSVARAAWEAGYFPEFAERPSINDLYEAIDQELRGNFRFLQQPDSATVEREQYLDQLDEYLGRLGVGTDAKIEDVKAAIDADQKRMADEGELYQEGQIATESEAFKRWFGDSKVIDEDGQPLVVYHGTTADFEAFDRERANPESDLGAGFYFSNTTDDVGVNYAGFGPDLTNKIEREAERIASETDREYDDPDVVDEARKRFATNEGATVPVYLSMQNPVQIGGGAETYLDLEQNYDEDADEYSEPTGALVDFIEGLRQVAPDFYDADVERAASVLFERGLDGGLSASEVFDVLKSEEGGLLYATNENGDLAGNELIRRAFEAAGYDGYIDRTVNQKFGSERRTGNAMAGMNEDTVHYVAFRPAQIKSIFNRGTFNPNDARILYQDGKRGSYNPETNITRFFKARDLSTMLHEAGHRWLESFADVVEDVQNNLERQDLTDEQVAGMQGLLADWDKTLKYLGVKDRSEIGREQHETFARTVEAYFMTGKAPSIELRSVFSRFKDWLMAIYKDLRALNVQMTPEITGVLDRMFATDEEIADAERLAGYEGVKIPGATAAEIRTLEKLTEEATAEAEAQLIPKAMAPIRRVREKWWKEEWNREAEQVEAEVRQRTEWRALELIRGTKGDGEDVVAPVKLNRDMMVLLFGEGVKDFLPRGALAKGGVDPDMAAQKLGLTNARELFDALSSVKDVKLKDVVRAETDARMNAKHGDILNDGSIESEAADAVRNEKHAQKMAMELRVLRRLGGDKEIRKVAERRVAQEGAQNAQTYKSEAVEADNAAELMAAQEAGRLASFARRYDREGARTANWYMRDIDPKNIRRMAKETIGKVPVRHSGKVAVYAQATVRFSNMSRKALQKRQYEEAAEYKYRQLLNHYLYMEARSLRDEMDKAYKRLEPLQRAENKIGGKYDLDYMRMGQYLMARTGLSEVPVDVTDAEFAEWRAGLSDESKAELMMFQLIPADVANYKDLTVDQFRDLAAGLNNLITVARGKKELELNGEKFARDQVVGELTGILAERARERETAQIGATEEEKFAGKLLSLGSALTRVEAWAYKMDGGKQDGPFTTYLVRPVMDALGVYKTQKTKRLAEIVSIIEPLREQMLKPQQINAPELKAAGQNRAPSFENKGKLIHAILHTGNKSNRDKLLGGYGWGEPVYRQRVTKTGRLSVSRTGQPIMEFVGIDTSKWDAFVSRMFREGVLTKADMDMVQAIWDLNESLKPDAQAAHKKMFGYEFAEVTAEQMETPVGTYRGGYMPAIIDRDLSIDGDKRAADEALSNTQAANMFPTTGRGFTKQRSEFYREPLQLNLMLIPSHVDKVLRFTHLEPTIKETAKIVNDRNFMKSLREMNPAAHGSMLVPWLQRTARQVVETPATDKAGQLMGEYLRGARKRMGIALMAGNIVNALQQVTGLSSARAAIGKGYMKRALVNYVRDHSGVSTEVLSRSEFMRNRLGSSAVDMMANIEEILERPGNLRKLQRIADRHGYFLQTGAQRIVDVISWSAAYDKAVGRGKSEADAVFYADSIVRRTQGDFSPENVSAFEAGSALKRLFTQFASYFNTQANMLGSEADVILRQDTGWSGKRNQLFGLYFFGMFIPAVLAEAIVQGARGELGDEDDDGYFDDFLELFLGSQVRFTAAMVPIGGQIAMAVLNAWNDKWYDDRISTSPVISGAETFARSFKSVPMALFGDGDKSMAVKDATMAVSLATGLPLYQLSKPVAYVVDVAEGDSRPQGIVDWMQGLISGRDGTAKK